MGKVQVRVNNIVRRTGFLLVISSKIEFSVKQGGMVELVANELTDKRLC